MSRLLGGASVARGIALVVSAALMCSVPVAASATPAGEAAEAEFFDLVNRSRGSEGLAPINLDPHLTDIARDHSGDMAADREVFHVPSVSKQASGWSELVDLVASGSTPGEVHAEMLSTASSKRVLLGRYDDIGIGVVFSGTTLYVTQIARRARPEPPSEPLPPDDRARGLVHAGLQRPTEGRCKGHFRTEITQRCTHGPDAPIAASDAASGPAAGTGAIACDGDGISGKRFQAIYARASDRPDRFATYSASIPGWAGNVDTAFVNSSASTGITVRPRFVTDANCQLSILNVVMATNGDDSFDKTISELKSKGFNRTDRVYMIWMDADIYCGIATIDSDDRDDPGNYNNTGPGYARVDVPCWGHKASLEAHEMLHTIGAVQRSAPHSTYKQSTAPGTFHCSDESDRMCYSDASGVVMNVVCGPEVEPLFDCGGDDYFFAGEFPDDYLATHWNSARSDFLLRTATQTFRDVLMTDYAFRSVEAIHAAGITSGCRSDSTGRYYCPDGQVTRREMAVFIARAAGLVPCETCPQTFVDVPKSDWAFAAIASIADAGITAGCSGTKAGGDMRYCPDASVTRREMAVFIDRAFSYTLCNGCPVSFTDVAASDWGYRWIETLYARGITAGCASDADGSKRYCPDSSVSRREMGVFLARAAKLI